MCNLANDSFVLYTVPGNLFVSFAVLHFITELFMAFDANRVVLTVKSPKRPLLWCYERR